MSKANSTKNIIDYWSSVERFAPPKIEIEKTENQSEVSKHKDITWENPARFQYKLEDNEIRVHRVFLGAIERNKITAYIEKLLNLNNNNNGSEIGDDGISCLCSFQVTDYGMIIPDTYLMPEYFVSISCLNKKQEYPESWMSFAPAITKKFEDGFNNQFNAIKNRKYSFFGFDDLKELLDELIKLSGLQNFRELIKNTAIINSYPVTMTDKIYDLKVKRDVEAYKQSLCELKAPEIVILNSFYTKDLSLISKKMQSKSPLGRTLKEYLEIKKPGAKKDFRFDKNLVKKCSDYSYLPAARWPGNSEHALSIAQQIAVNLALDSDKGLFSVNGPPGTGKSTLLRDIISGVILKRADALAKFKNPSDAFRGCNAAPIDGFDYKVWELDESLRGHEIVIASSNNNAVENISKEIPRKTEIDDCYNLDYFSEIASNILGTKSWGFGSAVLGNKTNRSDFFNLFWSIEPPKECDKDSKKSETFHKNKKTQLYGLKFLLKNIKPKSSWTDCKNKFFASKAKFEKLTEELKELSSAITELPLVRKELEKFSSKEQALKNKVFEIEEQISNYIQKISLIDSSANDKATLLASVRMLRPAWYVILIDFFRNGTSYEDWNKKCTKIINDQNALLEKKRKISAELSKANEQKNKAMLDLQILEMENSQNIKRIDQCQDIIAIMQEKYQWYSDLPNENFWSLPDAEVQMASPWMHKELQDARAELFVDAMNLHKSFIINSSRQVLNTLNAVNRMLTIGWPVDLKDLRPHLWSLFFLVVPTISTTFASFANLFDGLGEDSIGYLLIDEAGQTTPQAAAGALYRAKRSIIVGDPLQVPPVVTISRELDRTLLKYYKVNERWSAIEESTQTLADRANSFGTYIGQDDEAKWVGCPLRVHRRCLNPMFDVANRIAYDNLMIQATHNKKSVIENIFPTSKWIDVTNGKYQNKWSKEEGEVVLRILIDIMKKTGRVFSANFPSLYIISPFRNVRNKMYEYLQSNENRLFEAIIGRKISNKEEAKAFRGHLQRWLTRHVGTVHAFQGKQTDAVILLLGGGSSDESASVDWASRRPNILNVAITRAKNLLFVVGSHNAWGKKPHFQALSHSLPKVSPEEFLQNKEKVDDFRFRE